MLINHFKIQTNNYRLSYSIPFSCSLVLLFFWARTLISLGILFPYHFDVTLFIPIFRFGFFSSWLHKISCLSLIYELLNWSNEFCLQIHWLIDITTYVNWQCLGLFLSSIVWVISKRSTNDTRNLCLVSTNCTYVYPHTQFFWMLKIEYAFYFMVHALTINIIIVFLVDELLLIYVRTRCWAI